MPDILAVNASILNQPKLTGLGVYAVNVLRRLLPRLAESKLVDRIVVLGEPKRLEEELGVQTTGKKFEVRDLSTVNPLSRIVSLNCMVSRLRGDGEVVVYSPTHHGVVLRNVRQMVTVHDLFALRFPANYRQQHYYFRWYIPWLLRRTNLLVVDSESTAADCRRYYQHLPPCEVVHLGLRDDLPQTEPVEIVGLGEAPFFLFVGATYHYKNCDRLISAFASMIRDHPDWPHRLVFTGASDSYLDYLKGYLASKHPELASRVVFAGYVSGRQLAWLYRRAVAVTIVSLYEGFGLPALEAMALDCPVIASNVGSLLEVCGTSALMVDPYDIGSIAHAMTEIVLNRPMREQYIEHGRENVKRFSWDRCADRVHQLLSDLVRRSHA